MPFTLAPNDRDTNEGVIIFAKKGKLGEGLLIDVGSMFNR